jgi:hypothetical protein
VTAGLADTSLVQFVINSKARAEHRIAVSINLGDEITGVMVVLRLPTRRTDRHI